MLAAQGAVRLYSRRVTSRLTLTEPTLLDPDRQARIRARLDRYIAAGARLTSWTGPRYLRSAAPAVGGSRDRGQLEFTALFANPFHRANINHRPACCYLLMVYCWKCP